MKKRMAGVLFFLALSVILRVQPECRSLFSPRDDVSTKLIELIKHAQTSIDVAVYMLTAKPLAQALIDAHNRGVKVTVIVDPISCDKFGKGDFLAENNVVVKVFDQSKAHKNFFGSDDVLMHHKFAIFDNTVVWTGSFNWTKSANEKHRENVIVTDDKNIITDYRKEFAQLLKISKPFRAKAKAVREPERPQGQQAIKANMTKNNAHPALAQAAALQQ
ncbi:MAG: DUF1669 domain-containing protein [Epsilonproteobacteria bacterium]|nr:DUF1669 domain-containing protein [Campylobacterota bacterium]